MDVTLLRSHLVAAGWLPDRSERPLTARSGDDLLRVIRDHHGRPVDDEHKAIRTWLHRSIDARSHLTCETSLETMGTRLIWWPRGVRLGRRIGIVSSRRSRRDQPQWFRTLADIVGQLDRRRDLLLTSAETTCHRSLLHLAKAEDLPFVELVPPRQTDPAGWLKWLHQSGPPNGLAAYVSPRIDRHTATTEPERDQLVIGLADDIFVLRLRPNGNLWGLLLKRAEAGDSANIVLAGDDLIGNQVAAGLLDRGAERFRHATTVNRGGVRREAASKLRPMQASNLPTQIGGRACSFDRALLCHWTRRCDGPWPDETEEQYLQQQFLDPWHDRSALTSLKRIVRMQRILATDRLNRSGVKVVAFTKRKLQEFVELRVYRSHLRRWDFEPFGICIDAGWLERRGAAPVIYGDEQAWRNLSTSQRPFFQPKKEDWMAECEWRHIGDVDLRQLMPSDGLVFVPDREAGVQLASHSRWPVVIV